MRMVSSILVERKCKYDWHICLCLIAKYHIYDPTSVYFSKKSPLSKQWSRQIAGLAIKKDIYRAKALEGIACLRVWESSHYVLGQESNFSVFP
jgi:hypothetical protein